MYPRRGSDISIDGEFTLPYSLLNNKDYSEMTIDERYKWIEYWKVKIKAFWYVEIVDKLVFTARLRYGYLGHYNSDVGTTPFERFYLGGDGMSGYNNFDGREIIGMRGYTNESIVAYYQPPNGNVTIAGGGTIYTRNTLELRYPLSLNPSSIIYGLAFVEAYRSTLDEEYLDRAVETANEAIRRFYAGGKWRISDGEFGIFADDLDRGVPSPVAVIVTLLQDIQTLSDPVYGKFVFKSLEVSSYELTRRPIQRAMMTSSALRDRGERFVVASKYEKLHPYIGYRDLSPVPWLEFSVNGDEKYTLCGKESCFAEAENFEDIWIRIVEKWDKA